MAYLISFTKRGPNDYLDTKLLTQACLRYIHFQAVTKWNASQIKWMSVCGTLLRESSLIPNKKTDVLNETPGYC